MSAANLEFLPGPLRVSSNGRYFVDNNGKPFFWLGDTLWELTRLFSLEDARTILENRKKKGFSAIQIMISGVGDGTQPNLAGQTPWMNNDPATPNEAYFRNVDAVVRLSSEYQLFFVLGIYHQLQVSLITLAKAREYARWIARRYHDFPNIIWTMYPQAKPEYAPVCRELAAGLKEGDGGTHLITVHPDPSPTSSSFIHNEPWLDFNMIQTCVDYQLIYKMVSEDYIRKPVKPTVMAEGGYEGVEFGKPQGALEIRKQAYWSHLAGGHHSYGHNDNWANPSAWREWIDSPGSSSLAVYRNIITACREWWNWIPDQSIFASGVNDGFTLNVAARSVSGDWVMVYLSSRTTVSIQMDKITAERKVDAAWMDPTTGVKTSIGSYPNSGVQSFTTPPGWEDAVLVLEARKGI